MTHVGFVGLGRIGLPMARRLASFGHQLVCFDIDSSALAAAADSGLRCGSSLADLAAESWAVCTCLPSPAAVAAVVAGPGGLVESAKAGTLLIDFSTNDPEVVGDLARLAADRALRFLDSPVAGGVPAARVGELTVMVGAEESAFVRAEPLLRGVGSHVFHLGEPGAGTVAKLANNMLAFCNLAAAAEAFMSVKRWGLDIDQFLEVLEHGSGASAALDRYRRKVLVRDFDAEFTVDLARKDAALAIALGDEHGIPMRFASLANSMLVRASELGYGQLDLAAVVRALEHDVGEEISGMSGAGHV
ncbi:MAG TPA: NAD(P)-dependent oxidoreductase [Solirubrobacteraceae bacterium]|jgi:3-hydroxyisobutyrate dehydrogenase-like beta-hydroxyacid dehydrogenase